MEPKRQVAEQAAALLTKISVNDAGAISGGGADSAPPPVVAFDPALTPYDPAFAAAVVNIYENIVEATSAVIERLLGPNDSEP